MTKLMPQNFPPVAPQALASYTFTDLTQGNSFLTLYGAVHTSGSAAYPPAAQNTYYLTTQTPFSNQIIVSGAIIAAAAGGYISQNNNLDLVFNIPQRVKGYAFLNISVGGFRPAGGSNPNIWVSGAYLQNVTTSTIISDTVNSDNFELEATNNIRAKTMLMQFNLSGGPYHFRKNDVLRLHFDVWGTGGSSSGLQYAGYGIDPKDRADPLAGTVYATLSGAETTQMTLYLPIVTEIGQ